MKIFISWSGEASHKVAVALRDWLNDVLPSVKSFVSSEDLRKGSRWASELAGELSESKFGIICLTPTNLAAPWVLFEAGAISKTLDEGRVCTLLLGKLKPSDVTGPLSTFHHTLFEQEDMRKLVQDINGAGGEGARDAASLNRVFEKFWADLNQKVEAAMAGAKNGPTPKSRTTEDMLGEILELVRASAKRDQNPAHAVGPEKFEFDEAKVYTPKMWRQATMWKRFTIELETNPALHALIEPGFLREVSGNEFLVEYSISFLATNIKLFTNEVNQEILDSAASAVCGAPVKFTPISTGGMRLVDLLSARETLSTSPKS